MNQPLSNEEPEGGVPLFKTKDKCLVCGVPFSTNGPAFCGKPECPSKPAVLQE